MQLISPATGKRLILTGVHSLGGKEFSMPSLSQGAGFSLDAGQAPLAPTMPPGRRRFAEYLPRAPFSVSARHFLCIHFAMTAAVFTVTENSVVANPSHPKINQAGRGLAPE
jgi:hypothetical protein